MNMSPSLRGPLAARSAAIRILALAVLVAAAPALSVRAQGAKDAPAGVKNFGRVTDTYFRGGAITPEGVKSLAGMGVKTIVDLRDKDAGSEPADCKAAGITYYSFPMNGSERPDDAKIARILDIIQSSKEPVYVHCSAGKHRAGTVCALYRMRVQGWTPERAWAEQQSYGFGPADGHAELYAYAYGSGGASGGRTVLTAARSTKSDDDEVAVAAPAARDIAKASDGDDDEKSKSDKRDKKKDKSKEKDKKDKDKKDKDDDGDR